MATQIEEDARLILFFLARAPRNEYVEASQIAQELSLDPDRVNDATALLVEAGLVEWLQTMGTAPFDFGDAMITARGRVRLQRLAEAASPGETQMASGTLRLFVSHAADDVDLARRVVELISTALNLPAEAIRCTSVDGYRLPAGVNTDEQLRREVHEATAFIGIVSQSSMRSMYVLFELGARWGAGKNLIPLLAHGVSTKVMSGPLAGVNALRADSSSQLQQLVQDLARQLAITPQSPAVFDRALQAVLRSPETQPKGAAPVVARDGDLPAEADRVLVALATSDGTAEELASELGLSVTRTGYTLDALKNRELVGSRNYMGRPSEFYLKQGGRKHVVERGLVS